MGSSKKAFVSCKKTDNGHVVEAQGPGGDILELTVSLLVDVASGIAKSGMGFDDPKILIQALYETAVEILEK